MSCPNDFEKRIALSLTLQRYLRAADAFEKASSEFTDACKTLRAELPKPGRFVAEVSYRHYLVSSDRDGNFDVEGIESL